MALFWGNYHWVAALLIQTQAPTCPSTEEKSIHWIGEGEGWHGQVQREHHVVSTEENILMVQGVKMSPSMECHVDSTILHGFQRARTLLPFSFNFSLQHSAPYLFYVVLISSPPFPTHRQNVSFAKPSFGYVWFTELVPRTWNSA